MSIEVADSVLDRVDGVADQGEEDEEDDDDYRDDDVAFDHFFFFGVEGAGNGGGGAEEEEEEMEARRWGSRAAERWKCCEVCLCLFVGEGEEEVVVVVVVVTREFIGELGSYRALEWAIWRTSRSSSGGLMDRESYKIVLSKLYPSDLGNSQIPSRSVWIRERASNKCN